MSHRFSHDCKACTPLGQFEEYDLYHCMQGGSMPTVLARYGNEGPEYVSGLFSVSEGPLFEAQNRARARGLTLKYPRQSA